MENYTEDITAVNDLAAMMTKGQQVSIETLAPAPTDVDLPGGFVDPDTGFLIKYAVIRELNGADEELISKSGSPARSLNTILRRGVVSFGNRPAKEEDFNTLISGDRDALLLAIRALTFGDTAMYSVVCPSCVKKQEIQVNLKTDITTTLLEDPVNGRIIDVPIKTGTARVKLPSAALQNRLMEESDKTPAELVTIFLAGCLLDVNGDPAIGIPTALELSAADRSTIVDAVVEATPGPRLGEVTKACEACDTDIILALSLAELFRL